MMGCGGAAMDPSSSSGDGLCLTQKLSQVSLLPHPIIPPDDLLEPLCSQDFFCTPDFLTPVEQQFPVDFDGNKENVGFASSPLKASPFRSKRPRPDVLHLEQPVDKFGCCESVTWLKDSHPSSQQEQQSLPEESNDVAMTALQAPPPVDCFPPTSRAKLANMRRRVLSPPCIRNPFRLEDDEDAIPKERSLPRQAQFIPALGANCLSRYREEFHEIQEIGRGNFSTVFKVLKRIDGCLYAVKRTHQQLRKDSERRQALTEVQALAALGLHENVVRYHTAWFENDHLYIQMELCEGIAELETCWHWIFRKILN